MIFRHLLMVATPYHASTLHKIWRALQCVAVCCQVLSRRAAAVVATPYHASTLHIQCNCYCVCVAVCHVLCSVALQCVLPCVAVCCSVLQCVAVCCSVLQCVAVCLVQCAGAVEHCTQESCTLCAPRHTATHCNTLQHTTAQ